MALDQPAHCLRVQAESGDIVVVDVTPGADLSQGSIFESQVTPGFALSSIIHHSMKSSNVCLVFAHHGYGVAAQGLAHDPPLDAARLGRLIAAEAVAACSELPQQSIEEVDPKGYYSSVYLEADQQEETASDPLFGRGVRPSPQVMFGVDTFSPVSL